jgi:hypothetical protein
MVRDYLEQPHHLIRHGMVAPILRKRRFAPRIVRAAPNLARSFERHLRAENKPDRTVETYLEAVRLLEAFLAGRGVRLAEADRHTSRRSWPTCSLAGSRPPPP